MRVLIAALSFVSMLCAVWDAEARSSYTRGYVKKNGTYVQPHMKTTPNSTKLDNYSTKGNVNPYTGKAGTKDTYK